MQSPSPQDLEWLCEQPRALSALSPFWRTFSQWTEEPRRPPPPPPPPPPPLPLPHQLPAVDAALAGGPQAPVPAALLLHQLSHLHHVQQLQAIQQQYAAGGHPLQGVPPGAAAAAAAAAMLRAAARRPHLAAHLQQPSAGLPVPLPLGVDPLQLNTPLSPADIAATIAGAAAGAAAAAAAAGAAAGAAAAANGGPAPGPLLPPALPTGGSLLLNMVGRARAAGPRPLMPGALFLGGPPGAAELAAAAAAAADRQSQREGERDAQAEDEDDEEAAEAQWGEAEAHPPPPQQQQQQRKPAKRRRVSGKVAPRTPGGAAAGAMSPAGAGAGAVGRVVGGGGGGGGGGLFVCDAVAQLMAFDPDMAAAVDTWLRARAAGLEALDGPLAPVSGRRGARGHGGWRRGGPGIGKVGGGRGPCRWHFRMGRRRKQRRWGASGLPGSACSKHASRPSLQLPVASTRSPPLQPPRCRLCGAPPARWTPPAAPSPPPAAATAGCTRWPSAPPAPTTATAGRAAAPACGCWRPCRRPVQRAGLVGWRGSSSSSSSSSSRPATTGLVGRWRVCGRSRRWSRGAGLRRTRDRP